MDEEPKSERLEIAPPVATVTVGFFSMVTCWTDWGGWHWFADGLDEDQAREHLRQRLEQLDPFFGGPDYGPRYGSPIDTVDDLDPSIPGAIRRRITAYLDGVEDRWRRGLSP